MITMYFHLYRRKVVILGEVEVAICLYNITSTVELC